MQDLITPTLNQNHSRGFLALRYLQFLDKGADQSIQRIVSLAQEIYQAQIAHVSLVENQQPWYRSGTGFHLPDIPREQCFCAQVIQQDRLLMVNDAMAHELFRHHPMVAGEPGIRSYCGVPLHAPSGECIGSLCIMDTQVRDFTELDLKPLCLLAEVLEGLLDQTDDAMNTVYYDALTGLPNRMTVLDRLNMAIARAGIARQSLSVFTINIDNFRIINHSLGYRVGDAFLKVVADRLQSCLGGNGFLGRICGDEFVMVNTSVTTGGMTTTTLQEFANTLLRRLEDTIEIGAHEIRATASIGISQFPQDGMTANKLLECADGALTKSKLHGRNMASLYKTEVPVESVSRIELYNEMTMALQRSEFQLYYQPEFDLETGAIVSVEALLRWQHPQLGLLGPADFLDVAEDTGLIVPIGEWVIQEACREAQRWRMEGFENSLVAVNLSALQFKRSNLEQVVEAALQQSGLPARSLELELTESILIGDSECTLARMARLKASGVRLTMDDFGTGYSNLSYLGSFAFDKLKIDQCFIRRMMQSEDQHVIVKTIIQLAQNLKLNLIAEGIETPMQLQLLQDMGCKNGQGYLFARPMPAASIRELIRERLPS
ncbi:MAG: GGDEF domain-containing protein [Pseudomonadota bacterium]